MSDDTIYRRDAIEALNTEIKIAELTNAIAVQDYMREVHRKLCALPPAQPEIISTPSYTASVGEPMEYAPIVRCKDCKHYDGRPCGIVDWYNTADDFCSRAERRTDG